MSFFSLRIPKPYVICLNLTPCCRVVSLPYVTGSHIEVIRPRTQTTHLHASCCCRLWLMSLLQCCILCDYVVMHAMWIPFYNPSMLTQHNLCNINVLVWLPSLLIMKPLVLALNLTPCCRVVSLSYVIGSHIKAFKPHTRTHHVVIVCD